MPSSQPKAPASLASWIVFCAVCNCAGWALSACHQLNAAGYAVVLVLGLGALWLARPPLLIATPPRVLWRKQCRRFRRLFPLAFFSLSLVAILGGALYPPSNADGLTHRIPRTLNWLAEQRWHWIEKSPPSFNTRSCGFEWVMAPMLALLKTDRFVFLLNAISYLFFPGLVFGVLARLGVSRRVACQWMWLAPTGYCFVQQAGSIGNDAFGAVAALAAVDFALRAKASGKVEEVWLSMLSAGLLTSSKTSNLTLLLPWLVAVAPALRLLWRRTLATAAVVAVASGASLLPTAALNYYYTRDWSGASFELPPQQAAGLDRRVAFIGNALNLAAQNLVPPVFPMAEWWNEHAYRALPHSLLAGMEKTFEPGGAHVKVAEMQFEPSAGLGFGVSLLLLISWLCARCIHPSPLGSRAAITGPHLALVRWSPFISLLVYMASLALSTSARIIAPYYCLMMPVLLAGQGQLTLVRRRWWKTLGLVVFLLALMLVVINPGRPLWPAKTVLGWLSVHRPQSQVVARARLLYDSYATRWDALAPVRNALPPEEKNVGLIALVTASTLETSLWRPFGQRRIWWLGPGDSPQDITRKGIRYVLIGADSLASRVADLPFKDWVQSWAQSHHGRIVSQTWARHVATKEPSPWYVVEL